MEKSMGYHCTNYRISPDEYGSEITSNYAHRFFHTILMAIRENGMCGNLLELVKEYQAADIQIDLDDSELGANAHIYVKNKTTITMHPVTNVNVLPTFEAYQPTTYRTIHVDPEDDNYNWYDQADKLAKDGGINVLSHKDLSVVILDGDEVVAAGWHSSDQDEFDFDVAVHPNHRRKGLAKQIVDIYISQHAEDRDAYPDQQLVADVVNPNMVSLLKGMGFEIDPDGYAISGHTPMIYVD